MTAAISSTIAAVIVGPSAAPVKGAANNATPDRSIAPPAPRLRRAGTAGDRTTRRLPSSNNHAQHNPTAGIANARWCVSDFGEMRMIAAR